MGNSAWIRVHYDTNNCTATASFLKDNRRLDVVVDDDVGITFYRANFEGVPILKSKCTLPRPKGPPTITMQGDRILVAGTPVDKKIMERMLDVD